ncbi:hypothetical protein GCM10027562_07580 [Arthrobacter pigmenti]
MDWRFDEDVLATVSAWWGGRPGQWFRGNWHCEGSSGYDLLIEPGADQITVWDGILQDNVDGVAPLVVCADADVALKCLLVSVGRRFRDREGLDRLLIPYSPDLAMPGFTIHPWAPDTPEVEWWVDGHYYWLRFGTGGKATEFTFYGRASLEEIISSFESPDGAPLFTDVRKVPASSSERARP